MSSRFITVRALQTAMPGVTVGRPDVDPDERLALDHPCTVCEHPFSDHRLYPSDLTRLWLGGQILCPLCECQGDFDFPPRTVDLMEQAQTEPRERATGDTHE